MLTISAPIEVKAKSTYIRDPEAFYHRIKGNYSLMETHIGEEDLLHIAATPPEIYIQEGEGITSIFSQSRRNETNINKVNILNNVLNRIVTSADVNLTYQDRVFITDALYKLGVRDDRRFMKAFYRIADETRNTNTLINLYLERGGELRELIEEIQTRNLRTASSERLEKETSRTENLSEAVYDRLRTREIRDIVSNFEQTGEVNETQIDQHYDETNLTQAEMSVRQETDISQEVENIVENLVDNSVSRESTSQTTVNETVNNQQNRTEINGGSVTENISQSQTSLSSQQSVTNEESNFLYNTIMRRLQTGAIYQIVSNFNRTVESNEVDAREFSIADQSYTAQQVLLSVLRQKAGVGTTNLTFLNENTYEESIENEENLTSSVRNELTSAVLMDMVKNLFHTAFDRFYTNNETFYRFEDTFFKASDQTFLRLVGGATTEFVTRSELSENYEEENSRLVQNEIEILETSQTGEMTEEEVQKLTETVNAINVQNERRRLEFVKLLEETRTREQGSEPVPGMSQTREDAALALTDPEKLKERLAERQVRRQQRRSQILTELRTIIPDESMEIYQLLEQYYQGDTSVVNNNYIRPAEVGELIYDIQAAEAPETAQTAVTPPVDAETAEFLQSVKRAREEEKAPAAARERGMTPSEVIRRQAAGKAQGTGELIHNIPAQETSPEGQSTTVRPRDAETEAFLQSVKRAREEKATPAMRREQGKMPRVETIHRQSESLTTEELNEQLSEMETNLQKQINRTVQTQSVTENHVVNQTSVETTNTRQVSLSARDVEQLVENEIKSKMNSLTGQVMNKIERQMRNEKMRRGY
ncbi:hypothetical protein [Butyrivibrio sp. FCS014]|uniref:hypothetical protein n=1 Tax=Butyrivibrio sp. FCS014 TaxID=1408304 RepID=UPI0004640AD7|nr:hypothetical protein [Butyrivibrio sp. FCS014]